MNAAISIPDEVIRRYAYKKRVHLEEARSLFQQLLNYLDSASNASLSPTKVVDGAWHEFILHTKNYIEFCNQRYGRVVHHVPTSPILCESATELAAAKNINQKSTSHLLARCNTDCHKD